MIILGIETATRILGIGLADANGLIAEYRMNQGYRHSEIIAEATERLLTDAGFSFNSLDGIGVSIGPGSFTGLRVGVSYVKGLALATDLPVAAVPTMDAMIRDLPPLCETAYVLITARKGEVYRGKFEWRDGWHSMSNYAAIANSQVKESLPDSPSWFLGEGVHACRQDLEHLPQARFAPESYDYPDGYAVAAIGYRMLETDQVSEITSLDPNYLKPFKGVS